MTQGFDLREFNRFLVMNMYDHTGVPVVPLRDSGNRPQKPFHAYTYTSIRISGDQPQAIVYTDVDDTLQKSYLSNPKLVISISTYADDDMDCYTMATELRKWFETSGRQVLYPIGIVILGISPVNDRSTLLTSKEYEFRAGFDVTFRVDDVVSEQISWIGHVEINGEVISE